MELCLSPAEVPATNCILAPAQQVAADGLLSGIACGNVIVLQGDTGRGKTTILPSIHAAQGGAFLGMRAFMRTLKAGEPLAIEESWIELVETALQEHDLVI